MSKNKYRRNILRYIRSRQRPKSNPIPLLMGLSRHIIAFILKSLLYIYNTFVLVLLSLSLLFLILSIIFICLHIMPHIKVTGLIENPKISFLSSPTIFFIVLIILCPIYRVQLLFLGFLVVCIDISIFNFILQFQLSRLNFYDDFTTILGFLQLGHVYTISEKTQFAIFFLRQNLVPYDPMLLHQLVQLATITDIKIQILKLYSIGPYSILVDAKSTYSLVVPIWNFISAWTASHHAIGTFMTNVVLISCWIIAQLSRQSKVEGFPEAAPLPSTIVLDFADPFCEENESILNEKYPGNVLVSLLFLIGRFLSVLLNYIKEWLSF